MRLLLQSFAFGEGDKINAQYTCDGENVSPPLSWSYESGDVESFAILYEDPDTPDGILTHWILFNIPKNIRELLTGLSDMKLLSKGIKEGMNSFGKIGYDGPCPPKGSKHRYFFKIYALSTILDLENGINREQFLNAIQSHILEEGQLMGIYER